MNEVILGVPVGERMVGVVRSQGRLIFGGRVDVRGGRTIGSSTGPRSSRGGCRRAPRRWS